MKLKHMLSTAAGIGCGALLCGMGAAHASSYGTLCNFDTVNTTGEECHGFEIELEDCHSTDITRTYNYNHYGAPNLSEDSADPTHPKCSIRWESSKNPDGSWAAYTAIPSGPIDPTNGHQFTNPNVNFGGEHFGVSYRSVPTTVRYFWLVDRGGVLVRGPEEVQISTPVFTYNPPAGGLAGNVVARIEPPEPVEVHVDEFGPATWVKSIKTTTHNNHEVELRDLRSDDPDNPDDVNWKNGEPDEVEVEWNLLQEEFDGDGEGGGDPLDGAPEDLDGGDEIVTRRWEFYAYVGPYDPETHEAISDEVGPDDLHGVGMKTVAGTDYDLENTVVVGEFLGSQMAAFDVDPEVSLCEHLQDGEDGTPYPERTVVVAGGSPFTSSLTGALPAGMSFDAITGVLSGTPTETGEFPITVEASDAATPAVSRNYNLRVAAVGVALAPQWTVETAVDPTAAAGGTVVGDGTFDGGTLATVAATPNPGYRFVAWTELGIIQSLSANYEFPIDVNRQLVAKFEPVLGMSAMPAGQYLMEWPESAAGWSLQETTTLAPGVWADSARPVTPSAGMNQVTIDSSADQKAFFRLQGP